MDAPDYIHECDGGAEIHFRATDSNKYPVAFIFRKGGPQYI